MRLPQTRAPFWTVSLLGFSLQLLTLPDPALAQGGGLADTVLARVAGRSITTTEFLRQWQRVGEKMTAADSTVDDPKQWFLEQLVDKELLTKASLDAGFETTPEQEARLAIQRQSYMRRSYYLAEVLDGITDEPEEKRAALEKQRYEKLTERLLEPLGVSYRDSNLAFLAAGFEDIPPPLQRNPDGSVKMDLVFRFPEMDDADTLRVLANTSLGPFTIGRFWWHWAQVNPMERTPPTTAGQVSLWVERFLVQGPMDQEARSLGYDRLPEIESAVLREKEKYAADWYYMTHIVALVDTSEAVLREFWQQNQDRYHGVAHYFYLEFGYPSQSAADSALSAYRGGSSWEEIVEARFPDGMTRRDRARHLQPLALALTEDVDSTLAAWFADADSGQAFGPRLDSRGWLIYQYLEYKDGRRNEFAEARPFVLADVRRAGAEVILDERLAELRLQHPVEINEKTFASLNLPARTEEN